MGNEIGEWSTYADRRQLAWVPDEDDALDVAKVERLEQRGQVVFGEHGALVDHNRARPAVGSVSGEADELPLTVVPVQAVQELRDSESGRGGLLCQAHSGLARRREQQYTLGVELG